MDVTLQELRYIVAVADRRHFGRAAADCFVSQPTLSTQVKRLEERLGVRLFERTNKQVWLTPEGERIVAQARVVLEAVKRLEETAERLRDPFSGEFRLGVIATLAPYLLPLILAPLKRRCPKLNLIVREGLTAGLLSDLREHRLDIVLLSLPAGDGAVEAVPLFDEPFLLACPRNHPLAKRKRASAAEVPPGELLLLAEGHCLRDQALEVCGTHRAGPGADDFRATSLETLVELVAAGAGCTLLPALAWERLRDRNPGIAAVPLAGQNARRRIGLAWRRTYPRREVLSAIREVITSQLPAGRVQVASSRE